ncbi:threonine--tRNA ligase [Patescibacteria group bacterium]|nr:threonine--tRNA ligase [Patescibacteria group bacterium]
MKKDIPIEVKRHSLAHIMAAAILKLYPKAKFGVGPIIDNGFYYDVELSKKLVPDDLKKIEKEMIKLINQKLLFELEELPLKKAVDLFSEYKQDYKVELLNDLKQKGTTRISEEESQDLDPKKKDKVTIYKTGDFMDLCRGPHVESTEQLQNCAFSLDRIAGAYWRGDEKNKQLTRIYGLAFDSKKELQEHKHNLELAKERDHRKIGKELDLFHISAEVGSGLPLWTPKGTIIRRELEKFLTELQEKDGYEEVITPHIGKIELYKTSGHWQNYRENIYSPIKIDGEEFVLRPMNCPHHIHIYSSQMRSYRQLPVRLVEYGTVYRYEQSGELSGLVRVRGFTIDDAHIFCRPDQIMEEFSKVIELIKTVFSTIKFKDFEARIGLRDPKSSKYVGSDELWEKAEKEIEEVVKSKKVKYIKEEGEAAFYGPKLDFVVKDVLNREWQLGTIQVDYNLPERFKLEYKGADDKTHRPVMIHRAPFGSMERFVGIMIEHFGGAFPTWLSPVQVYIIPVGKDHFKHSEELGKLLKSEGVRSEVDLNRETVGYKIRKAEKLKVPYMLVIGDKEIKEKILTVRSRGSNAVKKMEQEEFIEKIQKEIKERK